MWGNIEKELISKPINLFIKSFCVTWVFSQHFFRKSFSQRGFFDEFLQHFFLTSFFQRVSFSGAFSDEFYPYLLKSFFLPIFFSYHFSMTFFPMAFFRWFFFRQVFSKGFRCFFFGKFFGCLWTWRHGKLLPRLKAFLIQQLWIWSCFVFSIQQAFKIIWGYFFQLVFQYTLVNCT